MGGRLPIIRLAGSTFLFACSSIDNKVSGLYSPDMARTKEFNPDKSLDAAIEVFWESGYERASLDALMDKMGVARQGLYDTFGDKRALYLKALERYRERHQGYFREILDGDRSVKKGFTRIFSDLVEESRREHERGCLLLNANVELSAHDEEVTKLLRENKAAVEEIFSRSLRRARKRGEISAKKDPDALALFLATTIQGMRATARLDHDRKALKSVATIALAALN
jgi:TetR/AcrR family transcriptional regulator, transcriptional repressor for nem operon